MNETINLNPRQKEILNIIVRFAPINREKISEKLVSPYEASKATLMRDLSDLIHLGVIQSTGSGPSTHYISAYAHPLLKYMDLDQYFLNDPDNRYVSFTRFNDSITAQLPNLFSASEKEELESIYRPFSTATSALSQTILERELERFIIELSWKSSKIEGNTYTLLETEALIKRQQEAKGHTKEEAVMILNHKAAFKLILEYKNDFKHISESAICQLHNVLTRDLNIDTGIRKHAVGITGTIYRPPDNEWQIREYLTNIFDYVNEVVYPLEKGLITLSMIAYLQPFADGNKRTARMLTNALLLSHDYFPLSYRSIDENEYKKALLLFEEANNLYHLKRLYLDQYRFALKTYFT